MGLLTNILQESVHDVTVECITTPATKVSLIPRNPPQIFGGQHLILYAKLPPNTHVSIKYTYIYTDACIQILI